MKHGYAYVVDRLTDDLKKMLQRTYTNVSFAKHCYAYAPELVSDVIILQD